MSYTVIIPSRSWTNLHECIRALVKADVDGRIVIIDDFDEVTRSLQTPGLTWHKGPKPFIFARNVNIGIRSAGSDDVLLLNDDALVKSPRGLQALAAEMAKPENARYGAVSCLVAGMAAAPDQVYRTDMSFTPSVRPVQHHMIAFMAVWIPRAVIRKVGTLDERFTGYGYEDDDYCLRLKDAGYELGVFDGCLVDHNLTLPSTFRGKASGGANMLAENRRIFEDKWQNRK